MKKNRIFGAMGDIDDRHIERFAEIESEILKKGAARIKRRVLLSLIAAVLSTAILCGAFAVLSIGKDGEEEPSERPVIKIDSDVAFYEAEDVASVFDGPAVDSVKTNAYVTIDAPSLDELDIIPVPEEEYLTTYRKREVDKAFDPIGFSLDVKRIASRFATASGKEINEPDTEFESDRYSGDYYSGECENEDYRLRFLQSPTVFKAFIYPQMQKNGEQYNFPPIVLDGMTLSVDQRQSDEEIIESLSEIKESLFEVFGAEFSDTKVVRNYGSYTENGVESLSIYLYNESDNPINPYVLVPHSDYIQIYFDNVQNYSGDVVSDGVLTNCDVSYVEHRVDVKKSYVAEASVKIISLEEAEEMLYNGYVFGGHSCKLCMEAQEEISFEDYDAVGLSYVCGEGDDALVIPFYTFYQKIGKCKNGNFTYAKTYVSAVKVSGLEEHFDMQTKEHKSQFTENFTK